MAGSQSQIELDRGVVISEHDADRVAEAMHLLPMVLLREDSRVQSTFSAWRQRMSDAEATGDFSPEAVSSALLGDFLQLRALVADLGLQRYGWLMQALRFEFQRTLENDRSAVELELPTGLPWWSKGRAPKNGETHREDLEQYVMWFYRAKAKLPRDSVKAMGRELAKVKGITEGRAQVYNGIRRAEQLLDCVNAEMPSSSI